MIIRTSIRSKAVSALASAALASSAHAGAGGPAATAEYEVVFDATWSAATHPQDFPGGAHFSWLIGGTHDASIDFWTEDAIASEGIERMAETGSKGDLRTEVQTQIAAGNAGEVIEGFQVIGSPGTTSATFTVSQEFPRATVVTMVAPSPDWFVGTSGLPLFVDDHWVTEVVFELLPYDAGTDSGVTYTSPNQDTQPPEPIVEIIGYPFADPGMPSAPLGTFTFRRLDAPPCPRDLDLSGDVSFGDLLVLLSDWGPCPGCDADLDGDDAVTFTDLLALLAAWGPCRP